MTHITPDDEECEPLTVAGDPAPPELASACTELRDYADACEQAAAR